MPHHEKLPIPLAQSARLLAISERTLRRLIDAGKLPSVRIGPTLALTIETLAELGVAPFGPPLIDIHDAAALLGVSPREVRAATTAGQIPARAIGHSLRWSPTELRAVRRDRS